MQTAPVKAPRILIALFIAMATLFLSRGMSRLLPSSSFTNAMDLRCFWDELRVVIHHHSPYDARYGAITESRG